MKKLALVLFVAFVVTSLVGCDSLKTPTGPGDAPIITQFSADSLSIKAGTQATLRWDVAGAQVDVRIDPLVGNVPSTGSVSVVLAVTTTFTLNARAPNGSSSQRVLTVIVTP